MDANKTVEVNEAQMLMGREGLKDPSTRENALRNLAELFEIIFNYSTAKASSKQFFVFFFVLFFVSEIIAVTIAAAASSSLIVLSVEKEIKQCK